LLNLGIQARGDLLALRAFCLPKVAEDSEEKLRHYDRKARRYAGVRSKRGGGLRTVKLFDSSTKEDVLEIAEKIFFPKRNSPLGQLCTTTLDKFDENPLPSTIEIDGKEVQFSLGGYLQQSHLTKAKFYLVTRPISFLDKVTVLRR